MSDPNDRTALDRRARLEYWLRWLAAVLGAIALLLLLAWIGTRYTALAWPVMVLPVAYLVAAVLYRFEDRLPGWASRALSLLAEHVWTVSWLAKMEDIRRTNTALLEDLDLTVREYRLGFIRPAARDRFAATGKNLLVRTAARRVAATLDPPVDAEVIELLHRERCGLITINLWQRGKHRLSGLLPDVLVKSERIPVSINGGLPATVDDLTALLPGLRDFDVDVLARELRIIAGIRERVRRYVRFLDRAGIATAPSAADVPIDRLVAAARLLPDGPETMFRLTDPDLTLTLMMEADGSDDLRSLPDDLRRSVHLGIFLAERERDADGAIERLCRRVAEEPDATVVLHAYLWRKGELRRSPPLGQFDAACDAWIGDAQDDLDDYDDQIRQLAAELESGRWPTERSGQLYVTVRVETGHDEVRHVDTYLITADGTAGPVTDIIKCLRATPRQRPDLVELGIDLGADDRPKYRFHNFTKNTQLGVVPRGMPFHDFYEDFIHDVDVLLHNRERTLPGHRWLPDLGEMLTVPQGGRRPIELTEPGPGPSEFTIERPPRYGRLSELVSVDGNRATVTWSPNGRQETATQPYLFDSFTYRAIGDGIPRRRTIHLAIHPPGASPLPESPKYVQYGEPRTLILRDNRPGWSDFEVDDHERHPEMTEPISRTADQAIVTYVAPEPAPGTDVLVYDEFWYTATVGGAQKRFGPIRLLLHSEALKQVDNFEITLERIDPEHCHELWFGDPRLAGRMRPPSACNVWCNIRDRLDPAERDDVRRVLERIAGVPCDCASNGGTESSSVESDRVVIATGGLN